MRLRTSNYSCIMVTKMADKTQKLQKCVSAKNLLVHNIRRFHQKGGKKHSLAPVDQLGSEGQRNFRLLMKPLGFTVLVTAGSFASCAVWQYEEMRANVKKMNLGGEFFHKEGNFRHQINHIWNRFSPGAKAVASIIALNSAVFCVWKVRSLQPVMMKWFCSSPFHGAVCSSMLLSAFSHYTVLHLGMNMYVLWSFMPAITSILGREQFVAFYLSAAVVSSLCSYAVKVARVSMTPSLGASGALLGVVAVVCTCMPESRISIALVDQLIPHSFTAGNAIKTIMVMDLVCLLAGFKLLDHATHLGGALFGLWYASYGHKVIWKRRESIMKKWHNFRGKP